MHYIGVATGFGGMIAWIIFCFRKSNKKHADRTPEKHKRNNIYGIFGWSMISSLSIYIINLTGVFGAGFEAVFWVEALMLLLGGCAFLIKGGAFLKDKKIAHQHMSIGERCNIVPNFHSQSDINSR